MLFREETLSLLKYRHVKEDLEKGVEPIHISIEPKPGEHITKGDYNSYDAFVRAEAVHYLRQYLEARRAGQLDSRIAPETLTDESPLIRDQLWDKSKRSAEAKPIGPKQIFKLVHDLMLKTGLVRDGDDHHALRVHTFRKYFKTSLVAAGVPESHVDYMMGHVTDTYNQIQSLGIERLRESYAKGRLSIRPQSQESLIARLLKAIHDEGKDPLEYLTRTAFSEPHRVTAAQETLDQRDARILLSELTAHIRQSLQSGTS